MKRITIKKTNGEWGVQGARSHSKLMNWSDIPLELYGALCKLRDYEDICDDPHKLAEMLESEGKRNG